MKNPFTFFLELFNNSKSQEIEIEPKEFLLFLDNDYFLIRKEKVSIGEYAIFAGEIVEIERDSIHHSLEKKIKLFDAVEAKNHIIASSKTGLTGVHNLSHSTLLLFMNKT